MLFFVARPGFEPRHTEPKSVVLPLYYRAIRLMGCKNKGVTIIIQKNIVFSSNIYSYKDL
jgi:hypothetical protein